MQSRSALVGAIVMIALAGLVPSALGQADRVSASEKGSLLIYPSVELRWDAAGNLIQDTFLSLQNDRNTDVDVQLYFLNGDPLLEADGAERFHPGWNHVDNAITLTMNQPIAWSAHTGQPLGGGGAFSPFQVLDPGSPPGRPALDGTNERVLRGTIYAWAMNADGEQIRHNHLAGTALQINYERGSTSEYRAFAFPAIVGSDGEAIGVPGEIRLGAEYTHAFDQLVLDFQAVGSAGYSGPEFVFSDLELTLMPVSTDFRQNNDGPVTTNASFVVWNENEIKFQGLRQCVTCWDQQLFSQYGVPNHTLVGILGTDFGRTRVDGLRSGLCDIDFDPLDGLMLGDDPRDVVSESAALLAIASPRLSIGGAPAASATNVRGMGFESAIVLFDPVGGSEPNLDLPDPDSGIPSGQDRVSNVDKGSLLIYSDVELRWNAAGQLIQDTYISLQNDYPEDVTVQLYFVNGDPPLEASGPEPAHPGSNVAAASIPLTMNQPTAWSASAGDPMGIPAFTVLDPSNPLPGRPALDGSNDRVLRGYLYAWAIGDDGNEIRWNHLAGGTTVVHYTDEAVSSQNAWAFQVVADVPHGSRTGSLGVLNLDGNEYAPAYSSLAMEFIASGSSALSAGAATIDAVDNALTLHTVSRDLRPGGAPIVTRATVTVWNSNEIKLDGIIRCVSGWDEQLLSAFANPNWFLIQNLGTDVGKARIEDSASAVCDFDADPNDGLQVGADPLDVLSENAALLGVRTLFMNINGQPAQAGVPLFGAGTQVATIEFPFDPAEGACCLDSGGCLITTRMECEAAGKEYQGDFTTCMVPGCPEPGACCQNDGTCVLTTAIGGPDCNGMYLGNDTTCAGVVCTMVGACCLQNGACLAAEDQECAVDALGSFQGIGTSCATTNCPQPGACCLPDGTCEQTVIVNGADCFFDYQGNDTTCAGGACGAPACFCDLDGNGSVGFDDVVLLLAAWDTGDSTVELDQDGTVGFGDLVMLLSNWGPCPE